MKDSKFYFGGFYFLLGALINAIIISIFFLCYIAKEIEPRVKKSDNIDIKTDTITDNKVKVDSNKVTLNDKSLLQEIQAKGIAHPKIVLAQAKLETGNYTSKVCITHNNLFGLRKPDGSYYKFKHWKESVKAYRDFVQYKYRPPNNYYQFLADIGYAEDKAYIEKVKEIVNQV